MINFNISNIKITQQEEKLILNIPLVMSYFQKNNAQVSLRHFVARSRFTPSNMVLRPLFNIETTLIWYCYHSLVVLRSLIYGVTTILTLISPKYHYDTTTTQIW